MSEIPSDITEISAEPPPMRFPKAHPILAWIVILVRLRPKRSQRVRLSVWPPLNRVCSNSQRLISLAS